MTLWQWAFINRHVLHTFRWPAHVLQIEQIYCNVSLMMHLRNWRLPNKSCKKDRGWVNWQLMIFNKINDACMTYTKQTTDPIDSLCIITIVAGTVIVHHNFWWYFTTCECVNCLTNWWYCGFLLGVGNDGPLFQ